MPDILKSQTAIIYCRVSSLKQATKGDGLASQETRCREYAKYKGYRVAEVFTDDLSGGIAARPGMNAALAYMRKHKAESPVIIIDDISRLARGLEAHIQLRTAITGAGGRLESPSIEFGEDSDSILIENLLASVSQHQRQKNGEQTQNRMRARAMNGYWVFHAPVGYRYERVTGHGKLLVRHEPLASIVQEALEGYASGRFSTPTEVKRFLERQPAFPKDRRGEVHQTRVEEIFNRTVYAGYISNPAWNLHMVPARHEALIGLETWRAIQTRRNGTANAPVRKDIHADFPLRGFVTCGHCHEPMTACWSKGRSAAYPYYLCDTKGCADYRKSIRKERIEGDFEALLAELKPSATLFSLAFAMFRDLWESRLKDAQSNTTSMRRDVMLIERKVGQFLDRIVETDSPSVISAYESRIRDLESEKALLAEKLKNCGRPLASFEETYRTAFGFLANPCNLWASDRIEDKRGAQTGLRGASALPAKRGLSNRENLLTLQGLRRPQLGKV